MTDLNVLLRISNQEGLQSASGRRSGHRIDFDQFQFGLGCRESPPDMTNGPFSVENGPSQSVKKAREGCISGKEDSVKETQEGCLSRSINKFFEHFRTFLSFEKLAQLVKERVL